MVNRLPNKTIVHSLGDRSCWNNWKEDWSLVIYNSRGVVCAVGSVETKIRWDDLYIKAGTAQRLTKKQKFF